MGKKEDIIEHEEGNIGVRRRILSNKRLLIETVTLIEDQMSYKVKSRTGTKLESIRPNRELVPSTKPNRDLAIRAIRRVNNQISLKSLRSS